MLFLDVDNVDGGYFRVPVAQQIYPALAHLDLGPAGTGTGFGDHGFTPAASEAPIPEISKTILARKAST